MDNHDNTNDFLAGLALSLIFYPFGAFLGLKTERRLTTFGGLN